jgi:hypothetical protein
LVFSTVFAFARAASVRELVRHKKELERWQRKEG